MSVDLPAECDVSYPDSVRYLYSLGNELRAGAKFGLEHMQTLLAELGNPERGQRFVHVAGTNGKGSTSAMIAAALASAGLETGLYTSPHLIEPTERIQVNCSALTADEFLEAFEIVHAAGEKMDTHPSYFETVTAMALATFRRRCDVSVLEVGLGGRLDATNVVTPELCVITPIAFDHESFLGNTLEAIASEKAGILKPGVPVVMARQHAIAEAVVLERARELGCDVIRTEDARTYAVNVTAYRSTFSIGNVMYECALAGRHQIENATAAILACRMLNVPTPAIQMGLKNVHWPGRMELISRNPDFVLDGAHNPAGAAALAGYIREFHSGRPVWVVYGAMRDKAVEEVTSQIFPLADRLILTAPDFPRALRPEAILDVTSHSNAVVAKTIPEAIEIARRAPSEATVFFTGSLFVVGEARELLIGA
ncbi:MAG: folylpolyglutamate synthase/dihydrofolate synthase family protein [Bryobacteraceae bacterium]